MTPFESQKLRTKTPSKSQKLRPYFSLNQEWCKFGKHIKLFGFGEWAFSRSDNSGKQC